MSVFLRMEQLCSHNTDFKDICYLSIFRKYVEKIQVFLCSDKNNGYFTRRPVGVHDNILLNCEKYKCFREKL